MMWRSPSDHGRKQETGGETINQGIDSFGPITEAPLFVMAGLVQATERD